MSKKTIEEQIAELTPEQKNSMGKIYKKLNISIITVFLICIVLIIGIFFYFHNEEKRASDEHDRIQTTIDINSSNYKYDFSLYDDSDEALDRVYDMQEAQYLTIIIGCLVGILAIGMILVVFKTKYPYYSEKKYKYLKKLNQ